VERSVADRAEKDGRRLIFFAPDLTDGSTIKRVQDFIDYGYRITVFGFRRQRYNRDYNPPWSYVSLGATSDGRYWHRIWALLKAIPIVIKNRRRLRRASVFYARNIDQLILALIGRLVACGRVTLAYEVLDIPPILTGRKPASILLRMIERWCLRHVRLLVLSSPGFHRNYYLPTQGYRREWFLLENKLHPSALNHLSGERRMRGDGADERGPYQWVVGYFGLIRGEATFDLMTRVAARLQDRVLFKFRGILTTVDEEKFFAALKRSRNMVYEGPYLAPRDLPSLYRQVDFAWALDLEHADHNSRWLLPCRFYEAGLHGVPCLAVQGFEIGALIERLGVGWTFDGLLEEAIVRFFETLTRAAYQEKCQRLLSLPIATFVSGDDVTELCRILEGRPRPVGNLPIQPIAKAG